MAFTVRTITDDEVAEWTSTQQLGFYHRADEQEIEFRRKYMELDRAFAAFDGARIVGTARSFPTTVTVPGGGQVPSAAVTAVAVVATHRRRGALREMMQAQFDDTVARGEPAAVLIASEAPIYGRYGYGAATTHATLRLDTARTHLLDPPAPGDGLRVVEREEMRRLAPTVFDAYRAGQPAELERPESWWDIQFGIIERSAMEEVLKKRFYVVHEGADGPDGYLLYRVSEDWSSRLIKETVTADELVATTSTAYAALWSHLLRLDWVATVEAPDRPVDEPLPYLVTDPRQVNVTMVADFLWARLLDVPASLTARTYPVADRLVLEVVDRFRPESGGRIALDAAPDGATCEPTSDEPDLVLDTADLAGAWLGGGPLWLPAAAGRVEERSAGAVARFDRLFVTQPPPFSATWF
ncbi:MAG: GNAT family N-acetyltransferase [Acidimicrobiales bacterium]